MIENNRIAFVIHGFSMGGAEKFLISIVNQFHKLGYNPIVITLSNDKSLLHELNPAIQVETILKKSKFDIFITNRIKSCIKYNEIKKVFCINPYAFFLTKLAFFFDNTTQFYLSLHSTIPPSYKTYISNFIYYRLVKKKDNIVYICNNQRAYLKDKYLLPNTHEAVIYNGINSEYYSEKALPNFNYVSLRAAFGFNPYDKIIVKVARINPEKGHLYAIEALSILHQQSQLKPHLVFVGTGEASYLSLLKKKVQECGLDNYVHFMGSYSDVRGFYGISDVFTLTSNATETFSIAALEAMSFGLPCSLTNIGGASEMMIEGVTGILSKPNDANSIALSWKTILEKQLKGDSIRKYLQNNFTADGMFQNYLELVGYSE